ncbi:MAG: site-specific DNA-methyltransferase [Firmicutes bacterium]|jgi:DNA modification methylase|nr:site-specific DNA-methyltransferase [Bacillota bacterium]
MSKMSKKRANDLNGKEWARYSISVWNDISKTAEEKRMGHPAMFPEMLIRRLINCFTTSKELCILDPFMGSGTTLVAACNMGRRGIGFDLNPEYVKFAQKRLTEAVPATNGAFEIYNADANEIPHLVESGSIDLCITSPPYWDILLRKRTADQKEVRNYGDEKGDLGLIGDYEQFLDALIQVFSGVFLVLKPGKYCIVNVMDLRKKSNFYPLHADLAQRMQELGFIFDDMIIWDRRQEYNNLRPLGYPAVFRINRIHEFLLIFKKPQEPQ